MSIKTLLIAIAATTFAVAATSTLTATPPVADTTSMQAVGTFKGSVTDKDGKPAKGIGIKLFGALSGMDGDDGMMQNKVVTTDDNGNFTTTLAAKAWKYEINTFGSPDGFARGRFLMKAGETLEKKIQLQ